MSPLRFTIELCPPIKPNSIEAYFKKFKHLLELTKSFSISSHSSPSDGGISGFDRSYNLANFLLKREPTITILFHVTCRDLNRLNIQARLAKLKSLGIKKILVVSGQGYDTNDECELSYRDSSELLSDIRQNYKQRFELIAIAGYPHQSEEMNGPNKLECDRLVEKSMDGLVGAIYTQCLFVASQGWEQFLSLLQEQLPQVEIIPSIALFNNLRSLDKSIRLTGVHPPEDLISLLVEIKDEGKEEQERVCQRYLEDICNRLESRLDKPIEVNICSFGLFDFAHKLIESLRKPSLEVPPSDQK